MVVVVVGVYTITSLALPLYRGTERGTDNEEMDSIIATLTTTHLTHCTAINGISIKISQ